MKFQNKVVVITGASAGIGAELARQLFDEGAKVFVIARRGELLQTLCRTLDPSYERVKWGVADVTDSESMNQVLQQAALAFGAIDIVIANAGFGVVGEVMELRPQDYRRQFETNVFGVLNTVYASFSHLKESQGQLVVVGSVAGFIELPANSPYSMSKFSVRALTAALDYEWRKLGITVTHLAPGFVDSEIRKVNNRGVYQAGVEDPMPQWIRVPTHKAVREMVGAIYSKKRQKVITGHGKILMFIHQYFPWFIPLVIRNSGLRSRREPVIPSGTH